MSATLPKPILEQLSGLVAERFGLHFPAERWGDMQRGLTHAATRRGHAQVDAYARRLLTMPITTEDHEALVASLTVGETYFMRERQSLQALEQFILPTLLRRGDGQRGLRIWSAGCCSGEEPYTIAMMLDRLLPDGRPASLLATDLNPVFLARAARAEYGEWSFRETPAWVRERYFQRLGNGRYRLHDRIRQRVTFARLNLVENDYPSPANGTEAMDVILCRNVLMYFTPERARAAIARLRQALNDGGWLIVSPAETSSGLYSGFKQTIIDGAILYQKTDADAPASTHGPPLAAFPDDPVAPLAPTTQDRPAVAEIVPVRPPAPTHPIPGASVQDTEPTEPDHRLAIAREHAGRGELAQAIEYCRQAIAANRLDPSAHYLLGTVLQAGQHVDEAAQALARAIYIDPDFVLAHFALGDLRRAQGRTREARKHFDHALKTVRALPAGMPVPESDGLTAGHLGAILADLLARLPRAA